MSSYTVQTQRMYDTKSEPSCKPWALGDSDVSMQVHPGWKCTILMSDAYSGGTSAQVGAGVCGESSSHFCCKPWTTILKK